MSATRGEVDGDEIAHSLHARQAADDPFGIVFLVLPVDVTADGDPTVGDREVEIFERHEVIRFERPCCSLRKVVVAH